ncbi:MAG: hypothetical protein ABIK09_13145 [Pseudomonadota bacterium]
MTCVPATCQTLGNTCGAWDDNCGGTLECGTCAPGQECFAGDCLMFGDTCANAIAVDAIPYMASGNTTGATPNYGYSAGMCPPETGGYGAFAPDLVYAVTPTFTNDYHVTLAGTNFDSNLYVVSDCGDVDGSCLAGDEDICSNCTEDVTVALTAGETYFVIVDGFGGASNVGAYALTIDCVPDTCAELGYECGTWDDGCGGSVTCAVCAGANTCAAGTCLPAGDTCDNPFTVGALPFLASGNTVGANPNYGYSAGMCPPESGGWGGGAGTGAPDEVYAFTPTLTGDYVIKLTSTFDSNLYVMTDCDDVNGSCVAGDEDACSNCTEDVTIGLTAGVTYYIVVDGYSNTNINNAGAYTLTVDRLGDTCNAPFSIPVVPFSVTGDTTGYASNYQYSAGSCPPETGGWGQNAPDQVYALLPTYTQDYHITLTGANFDSNLYVVSDCGDVNANCIAGDEDICSNCTEDVTVALTAGATYYIIVDGFSGASNVGAYTLTVDCVPDTCSDLGYECGSWDDGCGGTVDCGGCGAGVACNAGTCAFAGCSGGANVISLAPSGTAVLCDDPTDATCEQDFGTLCPTDWHLCGREEFNNRNSGWTQSYSPAHRGLGTIHCRSGSGAGHFTFTYDVGITTFGQDAAMNCGFGSSAPSCPASYGCNEKQHWALCCAPAPTCGNGVVDSVEETCDDGNDNETDACLSNCVLRAPGC